MGAYTSKLQSGDGSTQPGKADWITQHALRTDMSIPEVERLWLRFQQLGCSSSGILTTDSMANIKDIFMKNVLRTLKSADETVTFDTFLGAMKWCHTSDLDTKIKAIFHLLNEGESLTKDIICKIIKRLYDEAEVDQERISDLLFEELDTTHQGFVNEEQFVAAIKALPREQVISMLHVQLIPEEMEEYLYINLPEFRDDAGSAAGVGQMIPPDSMLEEIAGLVYMRDWERVANKLGFLEKDIKTLRKHHKKKKDLVFQILYQWKEREGEFAHVEVLERALQDSGMTEAAFMLFP